MRVPRIGGRHLQPHTYTHKHTHTHIQTHTYTHKHTQYILYIRTTHNNIHVYGILYIYIHTPLFICSSWWHIFIKLDSTVYEIYLKKYI